MQTYILRRLLLIIPTLWIVTVLLFLLLRVTPGDAVRDILVGSGSGVYTEADRQALIKEYGLDKPMVVQYTDWLKGFFTGDLGTSLFLNRPVMDLVKERFPTSARLGLLSLAITLAFSIPVGVIAALRADKLPDYAARGFAILGTSLPNFWLAVMIIVFPAIWWGWTPPLQYRPFTDDPVGNWTIFIAPAVLTGLFSTAGTVRLMRAMMLEVMRSDFIRTAEAKGLRFRVVVTRHALKNALIPTVTAVGVSLGHVLGGSVIMESIFGLPGVGALMRDSILRKDYAVVQSLTVFLALLVLVTNLIVDIAYAWLDPRIRYK